MLGFIIIIIVLWIIIKTMNDLHEDEKTQGDVWLNNVWNKYSIDDIEYFVLKNDYYNSLIYTREKRLFIVKRNDFQIKEIDTDDILDSKIDITLNERNVQRIISLTPTFDRKSTIIKVTFKIITRNNTFKVEGSATSLDEIERFKLILDRDLEELNSEKSTK